MTKQARELVGLIQRLMPYIGTKGAEDGACCENVSHGEYRALDAILRRKLCTMQDIAQSAAVTKSGATRIVGRLEGKGLARRNSDHKDGRICCVTLTEEGQALMGRIEDQLSKRMEPVLKAMDPVLREILILCLDALVQAAQRQEEAVGLASEAEAADETS